MQATAADEWRRQAATNRQGSAGPVDTDAGARLTQAEQELQAFSRRVYDERLESGIAREQARKDLPLSTYTEAYWKIDLHNLLHFLALRSDEHAQAEIRAYARTIGEQIVSQLFPVVWEAFGDYRVRSLQLTALDVGVIQRLVARPRDPSATHWTEAEFLDSQDPSWAGLARSRERDECRRKLEQLGLLSPRSDATD